MKRDVFIFSLVVFCLNTSSQSTIVDQRINKPIDYTFNVGDTIMFFPVNPNYVGSLRKGYTCFYNIDCLEYGINPKRRFAANNKKLTPFIEIESNYFYVKSLCDDDFNNNNHFAFSAILERVSDHSQVFFALPMDALKDKKDILSSWTVRQISKGSSSTTEKTSLVVPFLNKHFIDTMNRLKGKNLLFKDIYDEKSVNYQLLKYANGESVAKRFTGHYSTKDFISVYSSFVVERLSFVPCLDLIYSQPCLTISNPTKSEQYNIPVTHFAGNCDILYVIRGKIDNLLSNYFVEKEEYKNQLRAIAPQMDHLIGKEFYFDNNDYYYKKVKDQLTPMYMNNLQKKYDIKNGYYKCVDIDFFPGYSKYSKLYNYYVVFEDSVGQRFLFPTSCTIREFGFNPQEIEFTKIFESKENKEAKEREIAFEKEERIRLIGNYGEFVGDAIASGKCTESRYKELLKKYGKKKAEYMARGWIRVGWSFREVKESIGKEYFECVYSHETKYAYWEVYQFRKYSPSYVTFRNDVVVSIDDYMNTDF